MAPSARVLATAALLVACSFNLQGCDMPFDSDSAMDQFSKVSSKALKQAEGFANTAMDHAEKAVAEAKKKAEEIQANPGKAFEAAKKKAEQMKAAAMKKLEEAKKKGGEAWKKGKAELEKKLAAAKDAGEK